MGSSCGKGDTGDCSENIQDYISENKFLNEPCLSEEFSISLHSFSTTTNRLFTKRSSLTRGCKSVIVTQIKLEQNDPTPRKMTNTNSLLHMPVIRLSEMDVRLQLPELLPLNLFCGTQTIFSFIYPDTPEDSHVTLTGKIGTRPISMQRRISKNHVLTTEEISHLGKCLDIEMDRYKKNNRKVLEQRPDIRFYRNDEDSAETGSNAEASYSGLGYVDDSTDSDKDKKKQQARERRSKMRRKDTPSHQISSVSQRRLSRGSYRLKQNKQMLEGDLLQEEAEFVPSDGGDGTNSASVEMGSGDVSKESTRSDVELINKPRRPDLLTIITRPMQIREESLTTLPLRVSRSFSNMKDFIDEDSEIVKFSPISLKFEPDTPLTKRKKQSIGSRLSKLSYQGMKPTVQALPDIRKNVNQKDQDLDNDADDECECVSYDVRKRKDKPSKGDNQTTSSGDSAKSLQEQEQDGRSLAVGSEKEIVSDTKETGETLAATKDTVTVKTVSISKVESSKGVPTQSVRVISILSPKLKSSGIFKEITESKTRNKSHSESESMVSITQDDPTESTKTSDGTINTDESKAEVLETSKVAEKVESPSINVPHSDLESKDIKQTTPGDNKKHSEESKDHEKHFEKREQKLDRSMTVSMQENPRKKLSGFQRKVGSLEEQEKPMLPSQRRQRSPVEAFIAQKGAREDGGGQ